MSQLITIKNEFLSATISTVGAELQSVRSAEGKEYIWQGDPAFWKGLAPILFPVCGGLNEGYYTLGGKRYDLTKHGFVRGNEFSLGKCGEDFVEFITTDTAERYESYPFRFVFKVIYKLLNNSLFVDFVIENRSDSTMYYSCGSHEGFNLPNGIDGAKIVFEKPEDLKNYRVEGGVMSPQYDPIGDGSDTLVLSREYFSVDAIILRDLNSRSLTVCDKNGERKIRVDFPDFDRLLIWQAKGAPFVCIEPWTGLPDIYGSNEHAIEKKLSISMLSPHATDVRKHVITFD